MASLNKCAFIGNLGKDPDVKYLQSGDAVANFSIACTEKWKDKSTGETKETTEWVRCVAFGRKGEIAGQYLQKGSPCYVEGRMKTREYEKDGIKRYATEIVVDQLILLGGKSDGGSDKRAEQQAAAYQRPAASTPAGAAPGPVGFADLDDDVPFQQPFASGLWRSV
jgi:single-strand DNA-binding protein